MVAWFVCGIGRMWDVVHAWVFQSQDKIDGDIGSIKQWVAVRVYGLRRGTGEGEGLEREVFFTLSGSPVGLRATYHSIGS